MRRPAPHEDYDLWLMLKSYPQPPSKEEQKVLFSRLPDPEARDAIILGNMRFVVRIAAEYKHGGLPHADLIQEGADGLCAAIDKFEPERGFTFITYAVWWVRQRIRVALARHSRTVRVPCNKHKGGYREHWGLESRPEETYHEANIPEHWPQAISLNITHFSDAEEWIDGITSTETYRQVPQDTDLDVLNAIDAQMFVRSLEGMEQEVVVRYFGIGCQPETLAEIGNDHDLTRERIRQIKKKALARCRKSGGGLDRAV